MTASRAILLLCLAAAGLAVPGCGKKGPPLAPLARVPGRAMDVAARRTGDAVAISFTIPSANIDESKPADIERVEVYAYTAMAQNDVRDTKRMTLVGTVPVRRPPEPESGEAGKKAAPPPPPEPGEDQGALVTVTETLTAIDAACRSPPTRNRASSRWRNRSRGSTRRWCRRWPARFRRPSRAASTSSTA